MGSQTGRVSGSSAYFQSYFISHGLQAAHTKAGFDVQVGGGSRREKENGELEEVAVRAGPSEGTKEEGRVGRHLRLQCHPKQVSGQPT